MERFEIAWEEDNRFFKTYKAVFNFYMKIRDRAEWLYVFDYSKKEYLICENCICR